VSNHFRSLHQFKVRKLENLVEECVLRRVEPEAREWPLALRRNPVRLQSGGRLWVDIERHRRAELIPMSRQSLFFVVTSPTRSHPAARVIPLQMFIIFLEIGQLIKISSFFLVISGTGTAIGSAASSPARFSASPRCRNPAIGCSAKFILTNQRLNRKLAS